jgi:hypothetical protein
MNEKELLEHILTAELLTLAKITEIYDKTIKNTRRSCSAQEALGEVRNNLSLVKSSSPPNQ